ncbi:MAG: hypothetical protein PVH54_12515 [Gammaproteobacteria bacterium]|jgi:hypothetical protein
MIPGSESCIKSAAWSLVFCVIFLMTACSDDEPEKKVETEATAKEEPLPVREWYPRQKYSAPQSRFSQPQMMQPPVFSSSQPEQQQTWNRGYQVYQAPPVIIVQPQSQGYGSGTAGQRPEQQMTTPQQYVYPYYYYQAPQRPWGAVPQGSQGKQQSYRQAPAGNQQLNPWTGWQAPEGAMYPGWGVPYGGYPGAEIPGYPW